MNNLIKNVFDNCKGFAIDSSITIISVRGKDNKSFLQGQITNNIDNLVPDKSISACYCTHQGKVIANLELMEIENVIYILIAKELTDNFIEKISKYILMSDVEIKIEESGDIICSIGNHADQILKDNKCLEYKEIKEIDANNYLINMSSSLQGCKVLRLNSDTNNFKYDDTEINYSCLLDLINLQTRLRVNNTEKYIPQVLNSDILNSVSYKKGCYTGQEIVARTHYLGNVKKHAYLITYEAADTIISIVTNEDGESVGEVIGECLIYKNKIYTHCILKDSCILHDLYISSKKVEVIKEDSL